LALSFASRRIVAPSLCALVTTAVAITFAPLRHGGLEGVFAGCWISVSATSASVHLPRGLASWGAIALSLNAGVWAGWVIHVTGSSHDLLRAMPCVLIVLPAAWMIERRASIVVKVIASWLIAVSILAMTLQLLPVTPGYLPDHMD
jgi:hypothetical protein